MARSDSTKRKAGMPENAQAGPSNATPTTHSSNQTLDTPGLDDMQREILIQQRQAELKEVLDRHDDNLRELFHLERFVSLLYYDQKEAKKDHSTVFEEWKMKYDLVMNTPGAGPSRTTRRAQQERISVLKSRSKEILSTSQADSASPAHSLTGARSQSPTPISAGLARNKAGKRLSAAAKGKQKQSMSYGEASYEERNVESISGIWQSKRKARSKKSYSAIRTESVVSEDISSPVETVETHLRRLKHKFKVPSASSKEGDGDLFPASQTRGIKLKIRDSTSSLRASSSASGLHITVPPSPAKQPATNEARPTVSGKTLPGTKHPADGEPSASRPLIKRIRLIVREPPPTISSPQQKLPLPRFGKNLSVFLSSYRHVDGVDYDERGFESSVLEKARLFNRIEAWKKEGRLLLEPETALALNGRDEYGAKLLMSPSISSSDPQPKDVWSILVNEAISARHALSRHRFGRGGAIASGVDSRLKAYYNSQKSQGQREAAAEEKRLRALAKSTSRLVLAEWKKVVAHVREEMRLRREREEKRIGRQHLDAILDQSGQILEKQQLELHRTDVLRDISRSVSASADDNDEEDEMDDEEEEEEEETEVEDNEVADDETDRNVEQVDLNVEVDGEEDLVMSDHESTGGTDSEDEVGLSALLADIPSRSLELTARLSETPSEDIRTSTGGPSEADSQAETCLIDEENSEYAELQEAGLEVGEPQDKAEKDRNSDRVLDESVLNASPDETAQGENSRPTETCLPLNDLYRVGLKVAQQAIPSESKPDSELPDVSEELERTTHSSTIKSVPQATQAVSPPETPPESGESELHIDIDDVEPDAAPVHINGNSGQSLNGHENSSIELVKQEISGEVASQINGHSPPVLHVHPTRKSQLLSEVPERSARATIERSLNDIVTGTQVDTTIIVDEPVKHDALSDADSGEKEAERVEPSAPEPYWECPAELRSYAVARVDWHPEDKLKPPVLLRGTLRPYQQSGLEWLAALHNNNMNGILADEMGLGKTIQTIALLAYLACDRGIWGPHLIIVPTSVLLNWEMEFKRFLPGFKILSYHGTTKRRKELRKGWNDKYAFNVCVTSYTLASRDEHILKRKPWYYMILDEAHMIKNFKSQRWNILLMFKSFRRLLLTGTPLQNNLTELWALLQFLMSGMKFVNLKEFGEWFSNPLEKAIEQGNVQDHEVQQRVMKLHTVLRPYLLRRLKRDVEKELPSKYEHLVLCRLSKRQRFLYDEFMSRRQTREDLKSGIYQKIANILMQLRKVCNHPDLFEVRPIVTSFAMERSAIADFEIKELLIRRKILEDEDRSSQLDLDLLGLQFAHKQNTSLVAAQSIRFLEELLHSETWEAFPGEPPPHDLRTINGFSRYRTYQHRMASYLRLRHMAYLNAFRCRQTPVYGTETINIVKKLYNPLTAECQLRSSQSPFLSLIRSYSIRAEECVDIVDKFAFATPAVVARDLPSITLRGVPEGLLRPFDTSFDAVLHGPAVKLQIAFPDLSLLQYDCGKLQELARLLQERKAGGHRVLIFTQMTRILDILEQFLNFHGYLYLRLDGATKIEDRQYITERFNVDERIFAFIASSRSGGVGINLTGADTVIFYDSDFNPQMDRQCEDRAHRIGQIRDVHIHRFISQHTVEEAMLRKANQKRSLDDIVIQRGEFDWRNFFNADDDGPAVKEIQKALVEFEDFEDAYAAKVAAREEAVIEGEDRADFADPDMPADVQPAPNAINQTESTMTRIENVGEEAPMDDEEGGTTIDYMLSFVRSDPEYFREWKL